MVARDNENIFDLCIATGDINNLFAFLDVNSFSIDTEIYSGQEYFLPLNINKKENYIISTYYVETLKNTKQVFQGQNIFDVTCQYFGDISYLFTVIGDNNLSISDDISEGQLLLINNKNAGNEKIKKRVIKEGWIFNNYQSQNINTTVILGDYNDDYNDDFLGGMGHGMSGDFNDDYNDDY
jgi:hypothetical protein